MKPSLLLIATALLPTLGMASTPGLALRPEDRAWERFGLADRIPILGDLADGGCPSVTLLRLHPGTRLPPHAAPVDRTYLLLSGTVHVGFGNSWDEARMRSLPAGTSWVVPANTSTYEWTEGEAVCQVVATQATGDCPRPAEIAVYPAEGAAPAPAGSGERVLLWGDPGLPGCPWAERIRVPDGASPAPHREPPGRKVAWTVLSGALRGAASGGEAPVPPGELPAGTVAVLPAGAGLTGSSPGGAVIQRQFAGSGPASCRWRESLHPARGAKQGP